MAASNSARATVTATRPWRDERSGRRTDSRAERRCLSASASALPNSQSPGRSSSPVAARNFAATSSVSFASKSLPPSRCTPSVKTTSTAIPFARTRETSNVPPPKSKTA